MDGEIISTSFSLSVGLNLGILPGDLQEPMDQEPSTPARQEGLPGSPCCTRAQAPTPFLIIPFRVSGLRANSGAVCGS